MNSALLEPATPTVMGSISALGVKGIKADRVDTEGPLLAPAGETWLRPAGHVATTSSKCHTENFLSCLPRFSALCHTHLHRYLIHEDPPDGRHSPLDSFS